METPIKVFGGANSQEVETETNQWAETKPVGGDNGITHCKHFNRDNN